MARFPSPPMLLSCVLFLAISSLTVVAGAHQGRGLQSSNYYWVDPRVSLASSLLSCHYNGPAGYTAQWITPNITADLIASPCCPIVVNITSQYGTGLLSWAWSGFQGATIEQSSIIEAYVTTCARK